MDLSVLTDHTAEAVSGMAREIARICRLGRRAPGSGGERRAGEYLAEILREECGCADVRVESFPERPAAFYGYFWCSMTLDVLCAAGGFFLPWLGVLAGCCALALFVLQFVLYRPVIDRLFPERRGTNVTAVRPCRGETKRRIFLSGHLDAAWEFPLNYRFGGVVFEIPGVAAVVGVLYCIAVAVCRLCGAGPGAESAALAGLAFVPFFVLVGCTYDPRRVVDGANDNLTGCLMGVTLLREMERRGVDLEHTELGVVLTGSEEAGLRGAKAWSAAHRAEYADVPTYILCFDTIHDPAQLRVNTRDLNGTVKTDGALARAFLRAAEEAGVPCGEGMIPLFGGATDSAAFTRGGFRSAAVTGLGYRLESYYHTRRDTPDNLNPEGLGACYRAAVAFVRGAEAGEAGL